MEGTFLIAAGFNSSSERKEALVEFFRTQGDDLNITVGVFLAGEMIVVFQRASHMSGYHLASFPSILKSYIYQNDITTVLKKAFALIFDPEFRREEARVQENRLACLIINCTEEMETVKTLRAELRNLAQGFIWVSQETERQRQEQKQRQLFQGIHDYLLAQTRYLSADDDHGKTLFNEAVDLFAKEPKQFRQKALEIGRLFENYTEPEYKVRLFLKPVTMTLSGSSRRAVDQGLDESFRWYWKGCRRG